MNNLINEIPRLSTNKLISIFHKKKGDAHIPGCLIATRRSDDDGNRKTPALSYPVCTDAFIFILCEEGSFSITTNSKEFNVEKGDLYVNFPNQIMHLNVRGKCAMHFAVLELSFIRDMNLDIKPMANKMLDLKNAQCMKLNGSAFSEMANLMKAIADEIINNDNDITSKDIIRCLIAAWFFKISRAIDKNIETRQGDKDAFDRSAGYFKEFMVLLGDNYKKQRAVSFYAEKLRLSPKYFTTLIKKASGQTATEWITHYVILEAKNLLKYSTLNIQEIAYTLNFPNQSFFGKYFKHHTGMTPSEYKKK